MVVPVAVRLLLSGRYIWVTTEIHCSKRTIYTLIITIYARFLRTLLPGGGASAVAAAFLPGTFALAPFFRVAGAFFAFLTIVVPVDIAELLLVLLTVLRPSDSSLFLGARFELAAAALPAAALGRPTLGLLMTMLAREAAAAAAAATFVLAGKVIGFKGDAGRESKDF